MVINYCYFVIISTISLSVIMSGTFISELCVCSVGAVTNVVPGVCSVGAVTNVVPGVCEVI